MLDIVLNGILVGKGDLARFGVYTTPSHASLSCTVYAHDMINHAHLDSF